MGWWPLFPKRCLFLARRHEYWGSEAYKVIAKPPPQPIWEHKKTEQKKQNSKPNLDQWQKLIKKKADFLVVMPYRIKHSGIIIIIIIIIMKYSPSAYSIGFGRFITSVFFNLFSINQYSISTFFYSLPCAHTPFCLSFISHIYWIKLLFQFHN